MKEWKGNSDSSRSQLAIAKDHTTKDRQQDDFYATDPEALEALLYKCSKWLAEYFRLAKIHQAPIWECACGNGNLARCLMDRSYDIIATDLKDRGFGFTGNDYDFLKMSGQFLHHNIFRTIDIILTNPPYSLADEFIIHALKILPENGLYIALMNITYLAGQKRYEQIYRWGTLREVYVFSKRIECWKNNIRPEDKCGSMCNYAWYVFQKGYAGQPTLYWL